LGYPRTGLHSNGTCPCDVSGHLTPVLALRYKVGVTHTQGTSTQDRQQRRPWTIGTGLLPTTMPPLGVAGTSPQVADGQPTTTSSRLPSSLPTAKTSATAAHTSTPAAVVAQTWAKGPGPQPPGESYTRQSIMTAATIASEYENALVDLSPYLSPTRGEEFTSPSHTGRRPELAGGKGPGAVLRLSKEVRSRRIVVTIPLRIVCPPTVMSVCLTCARLPTTGHSA